MMTCRYTLSSTFLTWLLVHTATGFAHPRVRVSNPQPLASCLTKRFLADQESSDRSWMKDAMGSINDEEEFASSPEPPLIPTLSSGIAGFSVDPQLGFCAVLASDSGNRFTYIVVSPIDKARVSSPEALTLVQLAGGLDLGTATLPPDTLARLTAEEMDGTIQDLRPRISLLNVNCLPTMDAPRSSTKQQSDDNKTDVPNSPERDQAIRSNAPKVLAAVKNLPGLTDATLDDMVEGMQIHADVSGEILTSQSFSELLQTLRSKNTFMAPSKVKFELQVSVISGEGITEERIPAPTLEALGLSLRYKVPLVLSEECLTGEDSYDAGQILKRFPAFRPIRELYEDAKIMDGFIPGMYSKANLDNEQKM
jgi:hypothetical protein